jgi:hypothetical protein
MSNVSGKRHLKVEEIIDAIQRIGPYQTLIARDLGVTFQAIWTRKKYNKKVAAAYLEAEEHMKDKAEHTVNDAIDLGDAKIAMEYLKTKGKDRGYSTRVETTGAEGGPIRQAIGPDLENLSDDGLPKYLTGLAKAALDITSQPPAASPGGDDPPE